MIAVALVVIAGFFTISSQMSDNSGEAFFVDSDNIASAQNGCVATANWSCYAGGGYPFWIIEGARYEMSVN